MEPPPCFHNAISPAASSGKIAEAGKRVVTAASLVCDFFVTGQALGSSFRLTFRQRRCSLLRTVSRKENPCLPLLLWMLCELRLTMRRPSFFNLSASVNGRVWPSWDSWPVK